MTKTKQERDLVAIFNACPMSLPNNIEDTARECATSAYLFIRQYKHDGAELDESGMYMIDRPAGLWAHCSYCGTTDYLEGRQHDYKHKDTSECPFCGHCVTVYNINYQHKSLMLNTNYALMRVLNPNEAYIRCFFADFDFSGDDVTQPEFRLQEVERYYFTPGYSIRWKYSSTRCVGYGGHYDRYVYGYPPTAIKSYDEPYHITPPFQSYYEPYAYNFDDINKCFLRYSGLDIYTQIESGPVETACGTFNQYGVKQIMYLQYAATEPILEQLLKNGYSNLVFGYVESGIRDKIHCNHRAHDLRGYFRYKLTMPEIKELAGLCATDVVSYIKMRDEIIAAHPEKPEQKVKEMALKYALLRSHKRDQITNIPIDPYGILKYLTKTKQLENIDIYRDYINECVYLHYDLTDESVIYPKDLATIHDRTAKLVAADKDKKRAAATNEGFKLRYEYLKNFEFTYGPEYMIRVPKCESELVTEGKNLHHCVGGYVERHAKGDTNILFVRECKAYDTSFYTLEMSRDGRIIQCRGNYNNCRNNPKPDSVKAFEKAFEVFSKAKVKELETADQKAKIRNKPIRSAAKRQRERVPA